MLLTENKQLEYIPAERTAFRKLKAASRYHNITSIRRTHTEEKERGRGGRRERGRQGGGSVVQEVCNNLMFRGELTFCAVLSDF
jgi:hypothetical protein